MTTLSTLGYALMIAAVAACVSEGQKTKAVPEQTVFRESEPIRHAVSLPPKALQVLLETTEVKEVLGSGSKKQRDNPSQLFHAAEIHLGSADEVDFVVEGIPPASGADNTWFWIVCSANSAPTIALWTGADSLEVMATVTKGHRDLRSSWSSPTMTQTKEYHFDGRKYVSWKETTEGNQH